MFIDNILDVNTSTIMSYVYCHLDSIPTLVHPIHVCEQLVSLTNCGFVISITHPLRSTRNGHIVGCHYLAFRPSIFGCSQMFGCD
jgi:hypothetical protein